MCVCSHLTVFTISGFSQLGVMVTCLGCRGCGTGSGWVVMETSWKRCTTQSFFLCNVLSASSTSSLLLCPYYLLLLSSFLYPTSCLSPFLSILLLLLLCPSYHLLLSCPSYFLFFSFSSLFHIHAVLAVGYCSGCIFEDGHCIHELSVGCEVCCLQWVQEENTCSSNHRDERYGTRRLMRETRIMGGANPSGACGIYSCPDNYCAYCGQRL